MFPPSRLDRVLPDLSPRQRPRVPLLVCAWCFGLGVPPACGACGGLGYVVEHAQQSAAGTAPASPEKAGEAFAQPIKALICSECGHQRENAAQASACCTFQGTPCPTCEAAA